MMLDASAATLSEPVIPSSTQDALRQVPPQIVTPVTHDRRTVLLIDDNHHHRIPLLRALRAERYDVQYAADGARGEELFRTSLREIDALIACAEMRRMSGAELARRIRSARPEIAVLLMCGSRARPEHADGLIEPGYPVIEEPFTPEQLTRRLAEVLSSSRVSERSEWR